MTLPALPAQGATSWFNWGQGVHAAATEVTQGRLTDTALQATIAEAQPWFVVKPTGTNDHLKIRDAVKVLGHTNIELAAGTFDINGSIPAFGDPTYGSAAKVRVRGQGSGATVLQLGPAVQFGLAWRGAKAQVGGTNPISDVSAGATSLTTGSDLTGSLAAGDRFLLASQAYFGSRSYHRVAEWAQVKSITSTTITLVSPLRHSYASTASIKLWKYTLLADTSLSGVSFLGHPTATVRQRPVWFQYCDNPQVRDVVIDGEKIAVGIEIEETLGGLVEDVTCDNVLDLANSTLYTWEGYGVRTRGTLDTVIRNLRGTRCKHLHDDSSFDDEAPALRTRIEGGVAIDCISTGWSTHGGSDELLWDGSKAINCGGGFAVRGRAAKGDDLTVDKVTNPTLDIYGQTFAGALPQSYKHGVMLGENEDVANTGGTISPAGVGLALSFTKLDMTGGDADCHGVFMEFAQLDRANIDLGEVTLPAEGGSAVKARFQDLFQHASISGRVVSNAGQSKVIDIEPAVAGKAPQDVAVDLDVNGYANQIVHVAGRATSGANNARDIRVTVRAQGRDAGYADTADVVNLTGYFDTGSGAVKIADSVLRESKRAAINTAAANGGAGIAGLVQSRNVTSEGFDNTPLPDIAVVSGSYFFANSPTASGAAAMANGELRLTPAYLPKTVTITQLGAEVTVAGNAGSTYRLGIYSDASGKPGTLLFDSGATSAATPSAVDGSAVAAAAMLVLGTPLTLGPGWYWFGGVTQNGVTTAPTLRAVSTAHAPAGFLMSPNGTTAPTAGQSVTGYRQTGVTGALPATLTSLTSAGSGARLIFRVA